MTLTNQKMRVSLLMHNRPKGGDYAIALGIVLFILFMVIIFSGCGSDTDGNQNGDPVIDAQDHVVSYCSPYQSHVRIYSYENIPSLIAIAVIEDISCP
jgi:hypothetical protein